MRLRSFGMIAPLALLAAVLLAPTTAGAHPHVWADTATTVRFDREGRVTALAVRWLFDEIYSAYAIDGLDADGDGRHSPEELAPVAAENAAQLAEWGYFTVLKAGDERIALGPAAEVAMTLEKGRLAFVMVLPLAEPVDPRARPVTFSSFDPTFYIELLPAQEGHTAFEGSAPRNCAPNLRRLDSGQPAYVPDAEANAAAAEIDPGDPENSTGARFAEWTVLSCPSSS